MNYTKFTIFRQITVNLQNKRTKFTVFHSLSLFRSTTSNPSPSDSARRAQTPRPSFSHQTPRGGFRRGVPSFPPTPRDFESSRKCGGPSENPGSPTLSARKTRLARLAESKRAVEAGFAEPRKVKRSPFPIFDDKFFTRIFYIISSFEISLNK